MKGIKKLLNKFKEMSKIKKLVAVVIMFFVGIFLYATSIVLIDTVFGTDISKTVNNAQYQLEKKEQEEKKKLEKEAEKEQKEKEKLEKEAKKKAEKEQKEKEKLEKEAKKKAEKEQEEKEKLEKEAKKKAEKEQEEKEKLEKEAKKKAEKEQAKKEKLEKEAKDKEKQKPTDKKKVTMVETFVNIDNKMTINEAKKILSEYGEVQEYKDEIEGLDGVEYISTEISVVKKNKNAIVLTFRGKEMSGKTYSVDISNPTTKDWAYVNYETSLGGENSHGIWDNDDTRKNLAKGKSIKKFNKMVLKLYK